MPQFFFRLRTPDRINHAPQPCEHPNLQAALIAANGAARAIVRRHACPSWSGSFDVENDRQEPVARIMLADLVRQLS
jgi:hypothetical protein